MATNTLKFTVYFMNEKNALHQYVNEAKQFFSNCLPEKFSLHIICDEVESYSSEFTENHDLYQLHFTLVCSNVKWVRDVENYGAFIYKQWCHEASSNEFLHWLLPDRSNISTTNYNSHYGNAKASELAFGTLPTMNRFVKSYQFKQINSLSSILCSFSHLERHFILYISNTHHQNCIHTGEMGYKILINYDSLIKIVTNMDHSTDNPVELFLHMEYPPFIYATHPDVQPQPKLNDKYPIRVSKAKELESSSEKFERTFEFGCTCNKTLCDSRKKIGRYLVLKLVIQDKFQARWLIEQLILRLAKTEIAFASVKTDSVFVDMKDLLRFPWSFCKLRKKISEEDKFSCEYAWKSLHSRSMVTIHQVALMDYATPGYISSFKKKLATHAYENPSAVAKSLFRIGDMVDKGMVFDFQRAFEQSFKFFCNFVELNQLPKGMVHVRRVIITPSRILFLRPYEHFDNRIIRKFGVEYMLRVSVQDDNHQKLTFAVQFNSKKDSIMQDVVKRPLMEGLFICSRKYELLASSSSQLREHGMWMYASDPSGNTASSIRTWMGDFSGIKNVAKYMARMGQCLSTTEDGVLVSIGNESEFSLEEIHSKNGKYIFSDGIGVISSSLANEVREALVLNRGLDEDKLFYSPSAYQIRYKGCKGMVAEDPNLPGRKIGIRPSMKKFQCDSSDHLEIVKTSAPRRLYLNKHLITILEQMGIPKETFLDLQYDMMLHLLDSLIEESQAVSSLLFNLNFDYQIKEMQDAGFSFTNEPFFRSLLLAFFKSSSAKLRSSMRIVIPESYGRNMLGVLDETKTLKYGQVFVQYSESTYNPNGKFHVLKGHVIVSKNPCLHPGDVRRLTAVDVPALHHIKDCIVFPACGQRPHPDEMAGSDLDGDEYVVLWYEPLIFKRKNYPAMEYPVYDQNNSSKKIQLSDVVEFFCHYIKNDCIGNFANAHLVWADKLQKGIFSPICMEIAKNYPYVLDFAKHGTMKYLKKSQRPDQYPDFMQKGLKWNSYHSKKALGSIYRSSRVLDACSSKINLITHSLPMDPDLVYPGWEAYESVAKLRKQEYTNMITEILQRYGLKSECEAFSGMVELQENKQWRQEKTDTVKVIRSYLRNILFSFKSTFMKEVQKEIETNNLTEEESRCRKFQRASAWYVVTYNNKANTELSFPWVLSEVLAEIKAERSKKSGMNNSFLQDIDSDIMACVSSGILSYNSDSSPQCRCRELSEMILNKWICKVEINIWAKGKSLTCDSCFQRIIDHFYSNAGLYCCSSSNKYACRCSETCSPTKIILDFFKFFVKKTNASLGKCGESCNGFMPKNLQELSLQTLACLSITRDVSYLGLPYSTKNFTKSAIKAGVLENGFEEESTPLRIPVKTTELKELIENYMDEIKTYLQKKSGVSRVVLRPEKDMHDNHCMVVSSLGKNWQRWNLQEIVLDPNFAENIQTALRVELNYEPF